MAADLYARELYANLKREEPERPQTYPVYDHIMLGLSYDNAEKLRAVDNSDGEKAAYAEA